MTQEKEDTGHIYKNISVLPMQNIYAVFQFEDSGIHAEKLFGVVLSQVEDAKNDYCSLTLITTSDIVADRFIELKDDCYSENLIGIIDNNENPFKSLEDIKKANFIPMGRFKGFDNETNP